MEVMFNCKLDFERFYLLFITIWTAPCEHVSSGICGQRMPRSACASAQSDQVLHYPLTKYLDTTEYKKGEQRAGRHFARAQDDLNAHFAHVQRHVSREAVHLVFILHSI